MPKNYIDYLINETTDTNLQQQDEKTMRRRNRMMGQGEQTGGNRGNEISTILFRYRMQMQVYHWQTTSFARHKGSDEVVDALNDFIDKFMEMYMGKYGRPVYDDKSNVLIKNMSDPEALVFLDEMKNYFVEEIPKYLDSKLDSDLLNLRDEILGTLNKVKYLFTLA